MRLLTMTNDEARILRPSASHSWMHCTAYTAFVLSLNLPQRETSYATEGKAAHELAKICLTEDVSPSGFVGFKLFGVEVTSEMSDAIEKYIKYTSGLCVRTAAVEQSIKRFYSAGSCTPDFVGSGIESLDVVDLKYGEGVREHAKDNWQLICYALSAQRVLGKDTHTVIRIHIVQPRLNHYDKVEYTRSELKEKERSIRSAIKENLSGGTLRPSHRACFFCPAKAKCPAQKALKDKTVKLNVSPQALTHKQLAQVLDNKQMVTKWLNSVSAYALETLENGGEIEGYTLTQGRKKQSWSDEERVFELLAKIVPRAEMFEELVKFKLMTPSAFKKYIKVKGLTEDVNVGVIEALIEIQRGKKALVKEKKLSATELGFENLDEEN